MNLLSAVVLLLCATVFMTLARYGHLKPLASAPWWGRCCCVGTLHFEQLRHVPANRIGFQSLRLAQRKVLQEVITPTVFVPFAVLHMNQPLKLDDVWAALCPADARYFIFRN